MVDDMQAEVHASDIYAWDASSFSRIHTRY